MKVRKSKFWSSIHPDKEPYEKFDAEKIGMALVRAGARGSIVNEIAEKVEPYEGMTTEDINEIVLGELEKRDPSTAKYWKKKREYDRRRFQE
jgi:hypothetical protein